MANKLQYPIEDTETAMKHMKIFNHQVGKILNSNFLKSIQKKSSVTIKASIDQPVHITRDGATEEEIENVLTKIRLFTLDNDRISYRGMAQITELKDISPEWKKAFKEARKALNKMLNNSTDFSYNRETLTNHKLLDLFFHENTVHLTKVEEYELKVAGSPLSKQMLLNRLEGILNEFIHNIAYVKNKNIEEIERLSKK